METIEITVSKAAQRKANIHTKAGFIRQAIKDKMSRNE